MDAGGNAYVAGHTESRDFPVTPDAVQVCGQGQLDAFVTKVNPSGTGLLWSTYLGGAVSDWAAAIAVDGDDNIYLTGYGGGNPFPDVQPGFPGSFRPAGGGAFVVKISLASAPERAAPFISGVVNGATFGCLFRQNSWITIRGSNLAATTRVWTAQDIVNGILPTSLDGVSVTVRGKPAAVYYVSPTQINVLAPADPAPQPGRAIITVTNSNGTARSFSDDFWPAAPGWFTFGPQNSRYVAATLADGTYLGPPGFFGTALATKPAKPGDVVVLYGTGFGDTNPPAPSDRAFSAPLALANPPSITIGGVPAAVQFAGMTSPGLCQFNVVVPEVADGDREVRAVVQEHYPTQSAFLNIRR